MPAAFFSVASGSVYLFSAFLSLYGAHSFSAQLSQMKVVMYDTVLKPKNNPLVSFDIPWIPLIFAQ